MNGRFTWTTILSGTLLLCLALTACSQQQPASPTSNEQTRKESVLSDKAGQPAEQASGVSSGSHSASASTKSGGHPPVIEKVSIEPSVPVTGDQLRATVQASDPAGDQVTVLCRWIIDGHMVQESENPVLDRPLHRGAFVELEVVASDGLSSCNPVRISTVVRNASPTVRLSGQKIDGNNLYQASIEAADPEGDPIQFSLRSGAPGMDIDPAAGVIRWAIKPEDTGKSYEVQVAAQDNEGAETALTYQIKTRVETSEGGGVKNENSVAASK